MDEELAWVVALGIIMFGAVGVFVGFAMTQSAPNPSYAFQKDNTLIEYCYMNITSIELTPVRYGMETRMEKIYNYHEECVNRDLIVTSIGDTKQMETKKFGNYALQGGVYVKFSANDMKGLTYGDLI